MAPEAIISSFLSEQFSDGALAVLRADAVAGKVPHGDPSCCLIAHSAISYGEFIKRYEIHSSTDASGAYHSLSPELGLTVFERDELRMQRLIPIIDAELSRRAAARTEVITHAREAVRCEVNAIEVTERRLT